LNRNHPFFSFYNPKTYENIRQATRDDAWSPATEDREDWVVYLLAYLSRSYINWNGFCLQHLQLKEVLESLPSGEIVILRGAGVTIYSYKEERFVKVKNKKAMAAVLPPIADEKVYFSAKN
jgi:hypothetical protein